MKRAQWVYHIMAPQNRIEQKTELCGLGLHFPTRENAHSLWPLLCIWVHHSNSRHVRFENATSLPDRDTVTHFLITCAWTTTTMLRTK